VAGDLRRPDDEPAPVLALADGQDVIDRLAATQANRRLGLLVQVIRGHILSAEAFQDAMAPSSVFETMASSGDSTTAASRACAGSMAAPPWPWIGRSTSRAWRRHNSEPRPWPDAPHASQGGRLRLRSGQPNGGDR
jgi:hypothetical protein